MSSAKIIETQASEVIAPVALEASFVPVVIRSDADVLGMQGHERPRAAFAEKALCDLDTIAFKILSANPQTLDKFIHDQSHPIATLTRHHIFSYALYRSQVNGATHYTVKRTDIGSADGGFRLVRLEEGPILLSLKEGVDALDEKTDEYMHALMQILDFVPQLAAEYNIALSQATVCIEPVQFMLDLQRLHKKQHNLRALVLNKTVVPLANMTSSLLKNVFTKQEGLEKRKLRIGRIAAIAMLTPIPGHAEQLHPDVPYLLRPSSVEVVSDTLHAMFSPTPPTEEELAKAAYDNSNTDLPKSTYLPVLGNEQVLSVTPDVGETIATNASEKTIYFGSDTTVIESMVPQRLLLNGKLSPAECATIEVPQKIQTGNYAITAVSPTVLDTSVVASREGITLCNTSVKTQFFNGEKVYFDSAIK